MRYLSSLAERTGLWHQPPDEPLGELVLADSLDQALRPLREEFPRVQVLLNIPSGLRVRAGSQCLQTILAFLLENAFHAAHLHTAPGVVRIQAHDEGQTIRLEIGRASCRERVSSPV